MEPKRQLPVFKKEHSINVDDINKIVAVCDAAIKSVNQENLLAYFAVKTDTRTDNIKIKAYVCFHVVITANFVQLQSDGAPKNCFIGLFM